MKMEPGASGPAIRIVTDPPRSRNAGIVFFAVSAVILCSFVLFGAGFTVGTLVVGKRSPDTMESPVWFEEAINQEMQMAMQAVEQWHESQANRPLHELLEDLTAAAARIDLPAPDESRGFVFTLQEPLLSDELREKWWGKLPQEVKLELPLHSLTRVRFTMQEGETWISSVHVAAEPAANAVVVWQPVPNSTFSSRETLDWAARLERMCREEDLLRHPVGGKQPANVGSLKSAEGRQRINPNRAKKTAGAVSSRALYPPPAKLQAP